MSDIHLSNAEFIYPSPLQDFAPDKKSTTSIANVCPGTLSSRPNFLKRGLEGIEASEITASQIFRKVHSLGDKK